MSASADVICSGLLAVDARRHAFSAASPGVQPGAWTRPGTAHLIPARDDALSK